MDDTTCLVCLGDLATLLVDSNAVDSGPAQNNLPADAATSPAASTGSSAQVDSTAPAESDEIIATLLPCGHYLHNTCLRPWVERANSCPKCRTNFNVVELRNHLGGVVVDSYPVQDKVQVAEAEPYIPEEEREHGPDQPCIVCDSFANEAELLLCDGCSTCCHVYCAGLDNVPVGMWFCDHCQMDGHVPTHIARSNRSRTVGGREPRARNSRPDAWAQVWQSVRNRTNIDLDFPHEVDPEEAARDRARQAEFRHWQRRFTQAAPQPPRRVEEAPRADPESQAELRAWNDFDKANQLQAASTEEPNPSRKRGRSQTPTAVEAASSEPVRERKRPRQRRTQEITDQASTASGSSHNISIAAPRPRRRAIAEPDDDHPSFLSALVKECQSTPHAQGRITAHDVPGLNVATNAYNSDSPAGSPASSPPSSPRSLSPALQQSRPSSPPPLTSQIDPKWWAKHCLAEASPASPTSAKSPDNMPATSPSVSRRGSGHRSGNSSPVPGKKNKKPNISQMTAAEKTEVQALVKEHIKPLLRSGQIDSEQYTTVNRNASRKLYDLVFEAGGLNGDLKKWRDIAANETDTALKALAPSVSIAAD